MKIANFEDEKFLEELELEEINRKSRYKKKEKKIKQSFAIKDLIDEEEFEELRRIE